MLLKETDRQLVVNKNLITFDFLPLML